MFNSKVFEHMAMNLNLDSISVYRNVRLSLGNAVPYRIAAGCRYMELQPNVTERLLDSMGVNGIDRYKFFRNGYAVDMPCNNFNDSFSCYKFFKYGIYGKQWKRKPLGIPTTCIIIAESTLKHDMSVYSSCESIIRNTIMCDTLSSMDIYTYYKENHMRQVSTHRRKSVKTTPDNVKNGLVHTDYFNGSLQRDKMNTTKDKDKEIFFDRDNETKQLVSVVVTDKGHEPAKGNIATVDNLVSLMRKDVITTVKGNNAIKHYNGKCETLVKRIMRTEQHVTDIRIAYGKKFYKRNKSVSYALYAVVFRDDMKPSIIYFDVMGGIAYSRGYSFKNGKVSQSDYVKLSKVKNHKIEIYANKVPYEKTHKHIAA